MSAPPYLVSWQHNPSVHQTGASPYLVLVQQSDADIGGKPPARASLVIGPASVHVLQEGGEAQGEFQIEPRVVLRDDLGLPAPGPGLHAVLPVHGISEDRGHPDPDSPRVGRLDQELDRDPLGLPLGLLAHQRSTRRQNFFTQNATTSHHQLKSKFSIRSRLSKESALHGCRTTNSGSALVDVEGVSVPCRQATYRSVLHACGEAALVAAPMRSIPSHCLSVMVQPGTHAVVMATWAGCEVTRS